MTVQECYSRMEADYEGVIHRLEKDDRILQFLSRFLAEDSYAALCTALTAGNAEDAFRAAHSLKGICMNLGLTVLFGSSNALAAELRPGKITPAVNALLDQVTADYQMAIYNIQELLQA